MQQLPITVTIKNGLYEKLSIERVIHEAHKEIEEKGFSIVRVPRQKRLEFFYDFSKNNLVENGVGSSHNVLSALIICILPIIVIYAGGENFNRSFIVTLIFVILFLGFLNYDIFNKIHAQKNKLYNGEFIKHIPGIKDEYIIITKKQAYLNNHIFCFGENKIKKENFIEKYFTTNKSYIYKEDYDGELEKLYMELNRWNKTSNNISKLAEYLNLLETQFNFITRLEKNIKNELQKIKEGSFDFAAAEDEIETLHSQIKKTLASINVTKELITKIGTKIDIDYGLFQKFLNEKLIFSFESMQHILKKHIFVIDYKKEETKKYEDKAILLSNKHLEIYKKTLEKQVKILERETEKLRTKNKLGIFQRQKINHKV